MSNCNPTCIEDLPNFESVDICNLQNTFASGVIEKIIVAKCNITFTDINDPAEWTAKITSGDISIPFPGVGSIGEIQAGTEVRIGNRKISILGTKPFEFTTPIVDNVNNTEWALFNDLYKQRQNVALLFLTTDGKLLISPDWISGKNPAISNNTFLISQIFSGEENSNLQYKISGTLATDLSLNRVNIPASVLAVINA